MLRQGKVRSLHYTLKPNSYYACFQRGDYLPIPSLACEERVLQELSNDRTYENTCQCYQPCRETTYQKSVSLSYWPLEFYQYHALQVCVIYTCMYSSRHCSNCTTVKPVNSIPPKWGYPVFLLQIALWNKDTSELGTLLAGPKGVLISQVSLYYIVVPTESDHK
jgi:hypothetical protein